MRLNPFNGSYRFRFLTTLLHIMYFTVVVTFINKEVLNVSSGNTVSMMPHTRLTF